MSSLRKAFKTSSSLETKGVTLEIGNTRILVARAGGLNVKYNEAMMKLHKEHKRAVELDLMGEEKGRDLLYGVYAEHVVLDWHTNVNDEKKDGFTGEPLPEDWKQGIDDGKGGVIELTFENVKATFTELPDLFIEVKNFAENMQWYKQSIIDEAVKN